MKKIIYKFLCSFCAIAIFLGCASFGVFSPVNADEPVGKMSSIYGYILNDYIETFGVLSTDSNGEIFDSTGNTITPGGVIYGDILNFDNNNYPYLVIFTASQEYKTVSCHIWLYNDETERASRIAIIEKNYNDIPKTHIANFNIAWNNAKRYITYNIYENNVRQSSECYTVINGEAYKYVNNPIGISESDIADFNAYYLRPGVDVSDYNKNLDVFFSKLKNSAANSVTYENIVSRISADDRVNIDRVLINSARYANLDIENYATQTQYNEALNTTTSSDKFTQLNSFYDLGDGFYYATFDTTKTIYNYAILRKSDMAVNGYQLLKVRCDGIPLADRELKNAKLEYLNNPLLLEESQIPIHLEKKDTPAPTPEAAPQITVTVGTASPVTITSGSASTRKSEGIEAPKKNLEVPKVFDSRIKLPVACIGGGVAAALLTILLVYIYSDDPNDKY